MAGELNGRRVAILAADGVELVELTQPREAVESAGGSVDVVSLSTGEIQSMSADINPSDKVKVVKSRTLTSFPSLRTDLRNAGATVVDEEVVTDEGLVTSRTPDDLDAFCAKIVEEFAEGKHPVHDEGATA